MEFLAVWKTGDDNHTTHTHSQKEKQRDKESKCNWTKHYPISADA